LTGWTSGVKILDMDTTTDTTANLHDYLTGEYLRPATADELARSLAAAEKDAGRGVIEVDDHEGGVYAVEA
jgi:hypothetical protein